jgi:nucleoid DNA-binding protein
MEISESRMKKTTKEIVQKLATKYNLPLSKVEEIVMYQFKYVSNIMEAGNFDQIRIPYFGKFSSKKERREYINNLKNGSNNNR